MKRRSFVGWLGGTAMSLPLASRAQRNLPVLGFLNSATPENYKFNADAFNANTAGHAATMRNCPRSRRTWSPARCR